MKQSIKLERAELAGLFSPQGFTLYLRDGQDITLSADRADMPAVSQAEKEDQAALCDQRPPSKTDLGADLEPAGVTVRLKRQGRRGGKKPPGSRAERSAAKKQIFFQVLKETGNVSEASKRAGVTTSMGYRWRVMAAASPIRSGPKPARRQYRLRMKRRSRDFNQARNLPHWCRPCNLGFPSKESLTKHQEKIHGLIIRTPASPAEATA